MTSKLLENYDRYVEQDRSLRANHESHATVDKMVRDINAKIIDLHGSELFPNNDQIMVEPVYIGLAGQVVTAKTRVLNTKYTFTESEIDATVAGIYEEIAKEIEASKEVNPLLVYYPYMLVFTSGVVIDADTFKPTLVFKTRYDLA